MTLKGAGELFDMETLEIIGDSFLKFFVTLGIFCNKSIPKGNEGYLTQYRSTLVGNKRLFLLAKEKDLHHFISQNTKFEPHLNWKPPGFDSNLEKEKEVIKWDSEFREKVNQKYSEEDEVLENTETSKFKTSKLGLFQMMTPEDWNGIDENNFEGKANFLKRKLKELKDGKIPDSTKVQPRYHKLIPDKSIADCVEALIGLHLIKNGQICAVKFMSWLGLEVNPLQDIKYIVNYKPKNEINTDWFVKMKDFIPKSGLWMKEQDEEIGFSLQISSMKRAYEILDKYMEKVNVDHIEEIIGYKFIDKSFLLQALTHASYGLNSITDSYERLEFLGDAVLDFLITMYIIKDKNELSPGEVTNLRSALVNNTTLAGIGNQPYNTG